MKRLCSCIVFTIFLTLLPISAQAARLLVPGGQVIGLQLLNDTVTVAAFDETLGSSAKAAGLCVGDTILTINGTPAHTAEDVRASLASSGEPLALTIRRGNKTHSLRIAPVDTPDGPRLGIYLKQGIAGIGTVTWYDPSTGIFGTLGHGVNDPKGNLVKLKTGTIFPAEVISVRKGASGDPGQLKGNADGLVPCGTILRNTPQGVFGITRQPWQGEPLPAAAYSEVATGQAVIRSTVAGNTVREYSVEILKIYPEDKPDGRNFLLKVTDPALLDATGGIVQGMSGSPIIQNGKLVGAVTHVLVSDPTRGYGIFIENMLDSTG